MKDFFTDAKNLLTLASAVAAAIAATLSSINKSKIESLDRQVGELKLRALKENMSATFANTFLEKVLPDPQLKDNAKHVQALLSILNVIAQASVSGDGSSDIKARAIMPLQLALLMGQPGGVAAMDVDYQYQDDWVAMAMADDSPATRVTAIQALTGICQKALRAGRLDILSKGVQEMNELIATIPEDQAVFRASAVAARSQLASFITKEKELLNSATLRSDDPRKVETVRSNIEQAFPDAVSVVQQTKTNLQSAYAKLEDSTKPADVQQAVQVKDGLAKLDAALQTASIVTVQAAEASVQGTASNGQTTSNSPEMAINKIIPNLTSDREETRRKAQSSLALFGQDAVKPLLDQIAKQGQTDTDKNNQTRLGIAVALRAMRQPIHLDDTEAYWVVSLLRSKDDRTRQAAAEFLMNLEDGEAVKNCFDAIEPVFYELVKSPRPPTGNTVGSIAAVVGTWARNITQDTESRDAAKPFPVFALETAKLWKSVLQGYNANNEWSSVLETFDELIRRAEKRAARSAAPKPIPAS